MFPKPAAGTPRPLPRPRPRPRGCAHGAAPRPLPNPNPVLPVGLLPMIVSAMALFDSGGVGSSPGRVQVIDFWRSATCSSARAAAGLASLLAGSRPGRVQVMAFCSSATASGASAACASAPASPASAAAAAVVAVAAAAARCCARSAAASCGLSSDSTNCIKSPSKPLSRNLKYRAASLFLGTTPSSCGRSRLDSAARGRSSRAAGRRPSICFSSRRFCASSSSSLRFISASSSSAAEGCGALACSAAEGCGAASDAISSASHS
mmetsp:Transcript_23565/g.66969  ORF Transcript_23565/g.66969 Transcript_23565/m.66969 type:complete len:264 (-) Transcript_23565:289-1080(-)